MRKQNLYIIAFAIILSALFSTETLATTKSKRVTFDEDLLVGSTVVKKGDYSVKFDSQTNQVMISNGRHIVAEAPASLQDQNAREHYTYSSEESAGNQTRVLTAVNVGSNQMAVINLDNQGGSNPPATPPAQ